MWLLTVSWLINLIVKLKIMNTYPLKKKKGEHERKKHNEIFVTARVIISRTGHGTTVDIYHS